ncbi:MAG: DNA polymerase ligase N-terminal domain-containing protein [bacterium]|nr:DNA polymerase ligase N-terminal domain-containing protein [bacterium]
MTLKKYINKKDFAKIPEPQGTLSQAHEHLFVIQKHAASHLHYDFRLELNGVLLSWTIPKGPCFDPSIKRLALHVEDHPVAYGFFEGIIPKGEYGGGTVMLWDKGIWHSLDSNPTKAYQAGHLRFKLEAEKLQGRWDLLRFKDEKHWFLIKNKDEFAQPFDHYDVTVAKPDSVLSQHSIAEIAAHHQQVWSEEDALKAISHKTGLRNRTKK